MFAPTTHRTSLKTDAASARAAANGERPAPQAKARARDAVSARPYHQQQNHHEQRPTRRGRRRRRRRALIRVGQSVDAPPYNGEHCRRLGPPNTAASRMDRARERRAERRANATAQPPHDTADRLLLSSRTDNAREKPAARKPTSADHPPPTNTNTRTATTTTDARTSSPTPTLQPRTGSPLRVETCSPTPDALSHASCAG